MLEEFGRVMEMRSVFCTSFLQTFLKIEFGNQGKKLA